MTRKLLKILGAMVLVFSVFTACDTVDNPEKDGGGVNPTPTDSTKKKVLIEEFTGINCGYCPEGNRTAHDVEAAYEDAVFVLGIHAGDLAAPHGDEPDFRTSIGTALFDDYGIPGTPYGLVNRSEYSNQVKLQPGSFAGATAMQREISAAVKLELEPSFDKDSKKITLDVNVEYLQDQSDNANRLTVYIVEDKVVGPQIDYTLQDNQKIEEYEHHNVLRASMNGVYGDEISIAGAAQKGDKISKNFEYTITENWDVNNIKLLAFVSEDNDDSNILNVEWTPLSEENIVIEDKKNPVVINHEAPLEQTGSTLFGTEIVWDVKLENTSDETATIFGGYKIKSLQEGHKVSICLGLCARSYDTDYFHDTPYPIEAGEVTKDKMVALHLYHNSVPGTSEIEFYYFAESAPKDTVKRVITFIAN
jgi:thiol-disulfide isomerase/thioredoxin